MTSLNSTMTAHPYKQQIDITLASLTSPLDPKLQELTIAAFRKMSLDPVLSEPDKNCIEIIIHNLNRLDTTRKRDPERPCYLPMRLHEIAHHLTQSPHTSTALKIGTGAFGTITKIQNQGDVYIKKEINEPDAHLSTHENEIDILMCMPPHDNIIAFLGIDLKNNILLEYGGASNLYEWAPLNMNQFDVKYRIIGDILNALKFLSDQHIVHHDLKVENVVYNGSAKLIDFGFAYYLKKEEELNPPQKPWRGTLGYRAPEDCESIESKTLVLIRKSTDIWALGVLIYELYTCTPLLHPKVQDLKYPDVHAQFTTEKAKVQQRIALAYSLKYPFVPDANTKKIGALMDKCLLFDPSTRPSIDKLCEHYFGTD